MENLGDPLQEQPSETKENKPEDAVNYGVPTVPLGRNTDTDKDEPPRDKQNRPDKEHSFLRKLRQFVGEPKTYIEIAAIAVAIWIGFLNMGVLTEIRDQTAFIKESADAAKSAAETASKQLDLVGRPWLSVTQSRVVKPLRVKGHTIEASFFFVVRNSGASPALGVWVDPELYIPDGTKPDPVIERRRFCEELMKRSGRLGDTLFPGTETPYRITISIKDEEAVRVATKFGGYFAAVPILCIAYGTSYAPETRHYTGMIYRFGKNRDGENSGTIGIDELKVGISPEAMGLSVGPAGVSTDQQ